MGRRGRVVRLGAAVMVVSAGCAGADGRTLTAGRAEAEVATTASTGRSEATCTPLATGSGTDEVSVVARWKPGDSREFTISKERNRSARPELDDAVYRTEVQVKVVDVTAGGAAMQWRQSGKGVLQSSLGGALRQRADQLVDRLEDLTVDYSLDEDGQFEAVTNRDAIRGHLERMITVVQEEVAGSADEREALDRAIEIVRPVVLADRFIDTALAEPIITFHGPYGVVLSRAGSGQFDDEFPNPFGGEPIPANSSLEVLTPQDPSGCVRLRLVMEAKPGALSAVTDSLAGAAGLDASAREQLRQSARELKLQSEHRWVLDPTTGWPVQIESTKTTQDADTVNTDVTTIEAK